MKLSALTTTVCFAVCVCFFASATMLSSSLPPQGFTGITPGSNCRTCHSGNPLNANGGTVVISGLPENYAPGTTYTFSVVVNHANADRIRWGFSVKAAGTNNDDAGSFSTTNPNALNNGPELSHQNAPNTAPATSFTFSNLRWTAPTNPTAQQQSITFYVAGNASNGDFDTGGDFVYTATRSITLQTSSVQERVPGVDNWTVNAAAGAITLRLALTEAMPLTVSLYSLNGALITQQFTRRLLPGEQVIRLQTPFIQPGMYLVVISNGQRRSTSKVVL